MAEPPTANSLRHTNCRCGLLARYPRRDLQNTRSTSRRCAGAPGDFIGERPVNSVIHPAGLPIPHLRLEVLLRPVESSQFPAPASE